MAEYRAYVVGEDDHFVSFQARVCPTDDDAITWAKQCVDGHDIELWTGERFVARLHPDPGKNSR